MTAGRVTQQMMIGRSYLTLGAVQSRLAKTQEQLSTGRVLNRPSDSPTQTTSAMRVRSSLGEQDQFSRSAEDGLGWLGQIDATISSILPQVRRAKELGLQAANATSQNLQSRQALSAELDQIRNSLLDASNTTYLGRPVFGGLTPGSKAYDVSGTFVGVSGDVSRTVAKGVKVAVNVNGPAAFGPAGATLFDDLNQLSTAILAGDGATVDAKLGSLDTALSRLTSTQSDVGTRYNRLDRAAQAAKDSVLDLTSSLSEIENVDLTRATIDLRMNEVAYQAALSATARLVQPSLAEFLR